MVRYQYNIRTGDIHNPIDVIIFSENDGLPDGMTIDEDGCLWIAHWGGSKITRWNPLLEKNIKHSNSSFICNIMYIWRT